MSAEQTAAVIDIGASAVRLVVAELAPVVVRLSFWKRHLAACCSARTRSPPAKWAHASLTPRFARLSGFLQISDGYGVGTIRAVATSAVREAANADTFLDRVRVRTGLSVDVIDGAEESRLTFLAVRDGGLNGHAALAAPSALLVEVGGGSTDLTRLERGLPMQSGVYPLGSIRLRQRLGAWHGLHPDRIRMLTRQVAHVVNEIGNEILS